MFSRLIQRINRSLYSDPREEHARLGMEAVLHHTDENAAHVQAIYNARMPELRRRAIKENNKASAAT